MIHYAFAGEYRNVYVAELVDDMRGALGHFTCAIDGEDLDADSWEEMTRMIDRALDAIAEE